MPGFAVFRVGCSRLSDAHGARIGLAHVADRVVASDWGWCGAAGMDNLALLARHFRLELVLAFLADVAASGNARRIAYHRSQPIRSDSETIVSSVASGSSRGYVTFDEASSGELF